LRSKCGAKKNRVAKIGEGGQKVGVITAGKDRRIAQPLDFRWVSRAV